MAAEIKGKFSLDASSVRKGLDEISKNLNSVSKLFSAFGRIAAVVFATSTFKKAGKAALDYASEIRSIALQYGITLQQAQKLQQLAINTGVPVATMASKFQESGQRIGEAVDAMQSLNSAANLTNKELENIQKFDSGLDTLINKSKAFGVTLLNGVANATLAVAKFLDRFNEVGNKVAGPVLSLFGMKPNSINLEKSIKGFASQFTPTDLSKNVEGKKDRSEWYDKMTSGGGVDKVASSRNMDVIANRANELQRIGAFSGVQNPVLQINKQQLDELRKLNEKVAKGQFVFKDSMYS